jgi:hypothetical protein
MKRLFFCLGITVLIAACSRSPENNNSLNSFARQATELEQAVYAKGAKLEERLGGLAIGDVLLPDRLVTPEGRASGKATLEEFRTLIAERAAIRNDASIQLQRIIAAIPDSDIRDSARAGVRDHHEESVRNADEMDEAQLQLANAYEAILNWCEREGKSLIVQENQLRLSTSAQRTQLESLLSALDAAEKRENETVSRIEEMRRRSQRR